jgi:cell division inhibitor SulA
MQIQGQTRTYSHFNVLAQPTQPINASAQLLQQLAALSQLNQWILFTSECPRPDLSQLTASNICCKNVIQMKPSHSLTEIEIVMKAIRSGNAAAVVASSQIDLVNQSLLQEMAKEFGCEVFFVEGRATQYH